MNFMYLHYIIQCNINTLNLVYVSGGRRDLVIPDLLPVDVDAALNHQLCPEPATQSFQKHGPTCSI